jgi:ribonuclease P protein component
MDRTRVGVVVSKKLGHAVQRNRCKRRFRELARVSLKRMSLGWDLLILPKREATSAEALQLRQAWQGILARLGLLQQNGIV